MVNEQQKRKAEVFRKLHLPEAPLVLFNIWDPGSAKAVAEIGAQAIATSSWSVANANGFRDGEHTPRGFVIKNLRRIVQATDLPVTVDLEGGYGDHPDMVADTVALAIGSGAIGCNLEDSLPADGSLRDAAYQGARLLRAREAADSEADGFFINARCDVFLQSPSSQHDQTMLDEAIRRAHVYTNAGADGFFVPGLVDLDLIARLVKAIQLPVNVMVDNENRPLQALVDSGIARISYGPRPFLIAMHALADAAQHAVVDRAIQPTPVDYPPSPGE